MERLAGYRETLSECGMPIDEALITLGDSSRADGEAAATVLLERAPDTAGRRRRRLGRLAGRCADPAAVILPTQLVRRESA
ncbi:hypothetical protein [Streptomyces pakalii]|uniref:hypothetical protein n=1 Tax=Streptomyces pakalii TaxID=3036494 RepID=UPI0037D9B5E7